MTKEDDVMKRLSALVAVIFLMAGSGFTLGSRGVSSVGEVNSDGAHDLLIGAWQNSEGGQAQYHFEAEDGPGRSARLPASGELDGPMVYDDYVKPSSWCSAPERTTTSAITVDYESSDDNSGVMQVTLYYQFDDGGYVNSGHSSGAAAGSFDVTLADGNGVYDFYTLVEDRAGNLEDAPGAPDATTTFDAPPGITVGVSTNSDSYEFDDLLQIDVSVKNTGMSVVIDAYVVLTFDLAGPEETHWSASATGAWTEGISYYEAGLMVETGHDETRQVLSSRLPCQVPMIARSGAYTFRMAAVEPGTSNFASNLATSEFVLTGRPFVGIQTDKDAYSLMGDTIPVTLDVALPDYAVTADFYLVLLGPDGQFWSPTSFGADIPWESTVTPMIAAFETQPNWELDLDAFVINLPSGAPFDTAGQFALFTALVEPGTLTPYSDIGTASFSLQ
jgi:hypothetical protein